jgi:hypothetical protein
MPMAVRSLPVGDEKRILPLLVQTGRKNTGLCGVELVALDPKIHDRGVYETLDRMQARGLVIGEWEKRAGTRGKGVKVYKILPFGERTWNAVVAADEAMNRELMHEEPIGQGT